MSRFRKITDDQFREAILSSECMVDILEKLGYCRTSGTMTTIIKERAKELNISLLHLKGKFTNRGSRNNATRLFDEILVENSTYHNRTSLKKRLIKAGLIKEICYECGLSPEWNGKPLTLQLDHINGIFNDNRLINLRLLCPNCHSQTETFSGRNMESKLRLRG